MSWPPSTTPGRGTRFWSRRTPAPRLGHGCTLPLLPTDAHREVAEEAGASARMPVEWMDTLLTAEGVQ